ncbi:hypothetical protein BsWGS_18646 [Bradybaena similaris]
MTKTTSDIEAVTHLLEEKERDLELAARIGQTLLSKNKELSSRVEALEEQLNQASDKVNQLRHDLSMKDELIRYYNEEDLENETGENASNSSRSGLDASGVDNLEKKVKLLEDENLNLRIESAQLKADTDSYEEKEKKLVEDCIQQLAEVNLQVESLAEDLHQKAEENLHYKDEANKLLGQVNDLQKKIRKLTLENMDIREKLTASTESQRKLTQELGTMQDKYDEILQMLEEAQDELTLIRSRERAMTRGHHHHSIYEDSTDSLASELENSLQQELSQSSRRNDNWKVFETARAAKRAAAKAMQRQTSSDTRMSLAPTSHQLNDSQGPLSFISDVESLASDSCSIDMDRIYESNPELGRPGIPGSNDLESALKRLALRRANEQNEKDFQDEEMERRQRSTVSDMHDGASQFSQHSPGHPMFRSPMGSVSSRWSSAGMSANNQHYKLPEKLQIVKPLEGSMTLRQWQHLATPHLGGIFEERDGVQMKGANKLDMSEDGTLSDFEDDDHAHDVHTRKEQDMGLIYTFTDSRVRHPGAYAGQNGLFGSSIPLNTSHTDASMKVDTHENQVSSLDSESQQPPQMSHLYKQAADNTQSTYSMSLGLASLLHGRENTAHAIMRASSPPAVTAGAVTTSTTVSNSNAVNTSTIVSNSNANRTYMGSRSFDSPPLMSSTPKLYLGSRSFDQALVKKDGSASLVDSGSPKKTNPAVSTGRGLLQQLKNKGYSLYGLWGGASGKSDPDSSADGETLESGKTPSTTTAAESPLAIGGDVGILGALTNFRRSGLL